MPRPAGADDHRQLALVVEPAGRDRDAPGWPRQGDDRGVRLAEHHRDVRHHLLGAAVEAGAGEFLGVLVVVLAHAEDVLRRARDRRQQDGASATGGLGRRGAGAAPASARRRRSAPACCPRPPPGRPPRGPAPRPARSARRYAPAQSRALVGHQPHVALLFLRDEADSRLGQGRGQRDRAARSRARAARKHQVVAVERGRHLHRRAACRPRPARSAR